MVRATFQRMLLALTLLAAEMISFKFSGCAGKYLLRRLSESISGSRGFSHVRLSESMMISSKTTKSSASSSRIDVVPAAFVKPFSTTTTTATTTTNTIPTGATDIDTAHTSTTMTTPIGATRPRVLFVLGGPGAGKGTQCEKLSKEYGMTHLSAGELLREEIGSGSKDGQLIQSYLIEGKIVPVEITLALLRKKIETTPSNRFLVDGFPRNFDNVQGWNRCMTEVCEVDGVMFIDCCEEELERRILSRGQTSGRSDDNLTTARKRFATFKELTMPVIDHFLSKGMLIRIGGDQSVEAVFAEMKAAVAPIIVEEVLAVTFALLEAISRRDWDAYKALCDTSMTSFEEEAKGTLVEGLDFHQFYFDHDKDTAATAADGRSHHGTASNGELNELPWMDGKPSVRVLGRSAVVNYTRSMRSKADPSLRQMWEETRVWELQDGKWKQVHFHRGPVAV